MSARLLNDPGKYIRRVKGGRFQARPWCDGERYDLGLFATMGEARKAIEDFWWGRIKEKPRFVRKIRTSQGDRFIAEIVWTKAIEVRKFRARIDRGGTFHEMRSLLEQQVCREAGRIQKCRVLFAGGKFHGWVIYTVVVDEIRERLGDDFRSQEEAAEAVRERLRQTCGLFAEAMLKRG